MKTLLCVSLILGATVSAEAEQLPVPATPHLATARTNAHGVTRRHKIHLTKVKPAGAAASSDQALPLNVPPQQTLATFAKRLLDPTDNAPLTYKGITLYGAIDVGAQYQSHGTRVSQTNATGSSLLTRSSNHPIFLLARNQESTSFVGVKGKEELFSGFSAIFDSQITYNPTTATLQDGLKALTKQNGVAQTAQSSASDSTRAGQTFALIYGGFTSPTYGTLTFGRQGSLGRDIVINYDPMGGGNGFSMIGFFGATAASGATEQSIVDNALKYRVDLGPFRVAALYKFGPSGSAKSSSYQGGVGFTSGNFSIDAMGSHVSDGIVASSLSAADVKAITPSISQGNGLLNATVSDETAFMVATKYSLNTFNFFAGYENITFANPRTPLTSGYADIGGYNLYSVNNSAFDIHKVLQYMWVGVKYNVRSDVDLTVAYYHEIQSSFGGTGTTSYVGAKGATSIKSTLSTVGCKTNVATNCAGTQDVFSAKIDYYITKRFNLYLAAAYTLNRNGMVSGYLSKDTIDPTLGARLRF